ncbi:MAG TPA: hypothetical protein VGI61_11320 [Parafilimonas sp.]|jgi:hypothetical protein
MKRPENVPLFTKALLSCVLTGIAATIANGLYDILFRGITHYEPAEEFNFVSIPIATMIIFIILGLIFFLFVKYLNRTAFFITLFILMVAFIAITTLLHSDKSESPLYGNHGLIAGFVLINGILGLTLLPYLYNHPKKFI